MFREIELGNAGAATVIARNAVFAQGEVVLDIQDLQKHLSGLKRGRPCFCLAAEASTVRPYEGISFHRKKAGDVAIVGESCGNLTLRKV